MDQRHPRRLVSGADERESGGHIGQADDTADEQIGSNSAGGDECQQLRVVVRCEAVTAEDLQLA